MVYWQRWHGWCHIKLLPSWRVLCTPCIYTPCHIMQSHILKVYACLAVTCHLYFWQNDRDLLRVTVVTRGWNGYRSKSQHRKLTLEKKILPPLQTGALTTELSPPPHVQLQQNINFIHFYFCLIIQWCINLKMWDLHAVLLTSTWSCGDDLIFHLMSYMTTSQH